MTYLPVEHLGISLGGDGVLRLHLDKPAKRNALDDAMVLALIDAIDAAGRDESVRAILITAAGEHFCSGFDIVGRNAAGDAPKPRVGATQRRLPAQVHRLIPLMLTTQVPIVVAAQGWCAGIGLHLLLASDFALVADDARIWEPFAERGFTPDSGGTWLLPRRIGDVRARDMLLLGTELSGAQALEWGMVHAAVAAAAIATEAEALAGRLAHGPTVALGLTKWLLHESSHRAIDEHLRDEAFALELSSRSADFREGLAAFREKRPTEFTGR